MQTCIPTHDLCVAYYFFDFNDPAKQTVEGLLRCLIFQLAVSREKTPQVLEQLYTRHHKDRGSPTQPTVEEWTSLLLTLLGFRECFHVLIDALDECLEEGLLHDTIKSLLHRSQNSTRWLFTGQVSEEMTVSLGEVNVKNIHLETAAVDHDIARYLHATLENEPKLRSFSRKAKTLIISEIETKSRGMSVKITCDISLVEGKEAKSIFNKVSMGPMSAGHA